MKFVVGAIFGIIQFVLGIIIFIGGMITGGIIVDSSYAFDDKAVKKGKPCEDDEKRPRTMYDQIL